MKTIILLLLSTAALTAQEVIPAPPGNPVVTLLDTNYVTNTIRVCGYLRTITVTNWSDSPVSSITALGYTGPVNPNTETRFEDGVISEQTVVELEWKGQKKTALLESVARGFTRRSYTFKQERVYR